MNVCTVVSIDVILGTDATTAGAKEDGNARICTVDAESAIGHLLRIRRDASKNVVDRARFDGGGDDESVTVVLPTATTDGGSNGGSGGGDGSNCTMEDDGSMNDGNDCNRYSMLAHLAPFVCHGSTRHVSTAAKGSSTSNGGGGGGGVTKRGTRRKSLFVGKLSSSSSSYATRQNIIVPPMEYCSVQMLYHAKHGRVLNDDITEKGGQMKNILQSNKSFVHFLMTYPLKNTFRGYIQLGNRLWASEIALPLNRFYELFEFDRRRDRTLVVTRPLEPCAQCRSDGDDDDGIARTVLDAQHYACCSYAWPDSSFEFAVDLQRGLNCGAFLKRDPSIHSGSVVGIERIFVRDDARVDSIVVSPLILAHLNADFDGDAVTVMLVRGIEPCIELRARLLSVSMPGPCLDAVPRFKFPQSLLLRAFLALAFDPRETIETEEFDAKNTYIRLFGHLAATRCGVTSRQALVRRRDGSILRSFLPQMVRRHSDQLDEIDAC